MTSEQWRSAGGLTVTVKEHDALTYLGWVATELERGRQPAVDAGEFRTHIDNLGRYLRALEKST